MRCLAFGDVHLGQGADYGRSPGDRLRDQDEVLQRIAGIALDRGVDGILCGGDVFEGPGIPPEQLDVFARFVASCRAISVPILSVVGNSKHDAAVREKNGLAIFDHIPGITISATPDVFEFAGCAVATLPWVSPARLVAQRGRDVSRDEINAEVAQLLVEIAERGREDCSQVAPGAPAILLAHWSVTGSSLPNGLPVDQLREPVIPFGALEQIGFDAIVLGHIHAPQMLGALPPVLDPRGEQLHAHADAFYVGSPMPLNFGETGTAHGVWIIDLPSGGSSSTAGPHGPSPRTEHRPSLAEDAGSTPASRSTFIPIESRPLVTLDLTADELERWSDAISEDAPGDLEIESVVDAIVRVRYRATAEEQRRIDVAQIRRALTDAGAAVVRIQPEIVRMERARVQGLDESVDELDALDQYLEANGIAGDLVVRMRGKTRAYLEAVS